MARTVEEIQQRRGLRASGNGHRPDGRLPLGSGAGRSTDRVQDGAAHGGPIAGSVTQGVHAPISHVETILLATDGTAASSAAGEQAIQLAAALRARLLVVSVDTSRAPIDVPAPSREAVGLSDRRTSMVTAAERLVQQARSAGAEATFLVWEGEPGETIVTAADSERADLIVVGTHGRGSIGRFLIGSVSDYVVRHAHCPVLVVRPPEGSSAS